MSLALIESGVSIPGRIQIKSGEHKNKWVEPGQNKLSNWLVTHLGEPLRYPYDKANPMGPNELAHKTGIISFMGISSYPGGHIDLLLLSPQAFYQCSRSCFFDTREVRFWEVL
jgi:hypothetical protein